MDLDHKRAGSDASGEVFRVGLHPGDSVGHWRLGRRHEERFDVADRPMQGDMDPFFFLAKEKNFIPHEYPCRTEFIARYRGKHPISTIGFEPEGWWFPFGSPRVDLSGFWFRPTRIECWATTVVESAPAQTARFRFTTCGGSILRVNGEEFAVLSRYQRNLEESIEVGIPLVAGPNLIEVWFGDLCERDTRYYFELALVDGAGLAVALPIPIASTRAAEIERLLGGMHFDRPSYGEGEVAIVFPSPASENLSVRVGVTGDFQSEATVPATLTLRRGESRLVLGTAETFASDFQHFTIKIGDESFALSRMLAVEVCDLASAGDPSPDLGARVDDILRHAAFRAERDCVSALASLAIGETGSEIEGAIAKFLPAIADCHDCADFHLVPLLWCRIAYGDALAPPLREEIDRVIKDFRYWLDEPGNDVMWFFSENHALLFHTACYLAGNLFPDQLFSRSKRLGGAQRLTGRERLVAWFDHFEASEMAEWNSAPYFPIDLKGLAALFALAPDADIRARAERAILRLLEIVALSSHQGMLTASQGRSYEHSLRPCRTLELSGIARLFFGSGSLGRRLHALPLLALCVRDYGLRLDPRLAKLGLWDEDDALEWIFRQGPDGVAALYHHKTRDYAMGSVAAFRPGKWGYQETVLHLRLGDRPEAQIWINHPGEWIVSGHARPSYWGGCGTLPRVHQYRELAILNFELDPSQVEFTHAWLPELEMDEVRHAGDRVLIRAGKGLALLVGNVPFQRVTNGPTAGCEIRLPGRRSRWIVRLSDVAREGSLDAFADRFSGLTSENRPDGTIALADPDYGAVTCSPSGRVTGEGRTLDPAEWTHAGRAVRLPSGIEVPLPSHALTKTERQPQ